MAMARKLFAAIMLLALSAGAAVAEDATVKLAVRNMSCALCPLTVATAIRGVDGVKDVSVDYRTGTAVVVFDDARTTPAKIAEASRRAGYPASEAR